MSMYGIWYCNGLPLVGDKNSPTLLRVKFHEPVSLPFMKAIKIFLQLVGVFLRVNTTVQHAVISKKSSDGFWRYVLGDRLCTEGTEMGRGRSPMTHLTLAGQNLMMIHLAVLVSCDNPGS